MASNRTETLKAIHYRILRGDPSASSELFELLFPPLCRIIYGKRKNFELITYDDAINSATDAILAYLQKPEAYNPELSSIQTFLAQKGIWNLKDIEKVRIPRQKKFTEFVELEILKSYNDSVCAEDAAIYLEKEQRRLLAARYKKAVITDDLEEKVLDLYLNGERKVEAYAKVLGIDAKPISEQRKVVKRYKDKIEKRLIRLRDTFPNVL